MMQQLTGWCLDTGQEFWLVVFTNDGNVKRTAERLGMQRSHLYKKIERHGLR